MTGAAAGQLLNLFAAAESVGNDHRAVVCLADGREKYTFTDINRDPVMIPVIAERSRHPAAASIEHLCLQLRRRSRSYRRLLSDQRLLVTVHLHQRATAPTQRSPFQ